MAVMKRSDTMFGVCLCVPAVLLQGDFPLSKCNSICQEAAEIQMVSTADRYWTACGNCLCRGVIWSNSAWLSVTRGTRGGCWWLEGGWRGRNLFAMEKGFSVLRPARGQRQISLSLQLPPPFPSSTTTIFPSRVVSFSHRFRYYPLNISLSTMQFVIIGSPRDEELGLSLRSEIWIMRVATHPLLKYAVAAHGGAVYCYVIPSLQCLGIGENDVSGFVSIAIVYSSEYLEAISPSVRSMFPFPSQSECHQACLPKLQ